MLNKLLADSEINIIGITNNSVQENLIVTYNLIKVHTVDFNIFCQCITMLLMP